MTDWKTWPKCGIFLTFFFFFPEQQTCPIWVSHNFVQYEIWNLIYGWTWYKTEHRVEEVCCTKCFIVSTVTSIHVCFDKQVHNKLDKIRQAKKIKSLNLAESNAHQNKRARGSFETYNFFFSLTLYKKEIILPQVWREIIADKLTNTI